MKTRILVLLVAVAVFAIPSFADEPGGNSTYQQLRPVDDYNDGGWGGSYDLATYMDNPCTAVQDWVVVDYNVQLAQDALAAGTKERYLFDEQMAMYGSYAASGASQADVAYMLQPFTIRNYHKVANTYDQFHVVTVINFDPATRETSVTVETACGDGTPSSPQ
jgi:PDZ domain-containing secreted protein